ncbi:MAG TPA: M13 family metallopeptidase [Kofleriaceae bacterium]|nr:M13 family metallopeptidase [Kofleriaceae bacterium]
MKQYTVLVAATMALGCGSRHEPAPAGPAPQAAAASAATPPAPVAAVARPEIGAWGCDLAGMDPTIRPGAAFYQYANGRWLNATQIPADRSAYTMHMRASDRVHQRARAIIEAASGPPGSDAQRIGDYYRTFLDEAAIEAAGIAPLQPELDRIAAIRDRRRVMLALAASARRFETTPFRAYVLVDDRRPDHYLALVTQGGLGLPDRDMYDAGARQFAPLRDAYRQYIAAMFALIGWPDADRRAAAVYALEDQIAHAHWTSVQSRDPQKMYNPMPPAALAKLAPGLDWTPWLAAVGLDREAVINVMQPSAIAALGRLVAREPVAVWRDYLTLQLLTASAPYLPKRFVDAHFEMFGKALSGKQQLAERRARAIDEVTDKLGDAVARIYVERYFTPETRAAAEQLVTNLRRALERRIDNLGWMTEQTKTRAKEKLAAVRAEIGAPPTWRDDSALAIVPGDAVGNARRAHEFEYARVLAQLGTAPRGDEWPEWLTPMTVDAVPVQLPAALFQPPFFDPAADLAINYGGVGAYIGHEFSHLFDDRGAQYDATGALRNWWTPEDARQFKAATEKLVAQYNTYCPIPARDGKPAQCVNGAFTLSENVADLVGVTIAHDAYEVALGGRPAPVLDGLTGEQRFFLGWAQIWRARLREQRLAASLVQDFHSPPEYRVDTVRNLDAWYDAFQPSPSDALYLPPEQRVRIW